MTANFVKEKKALNFKRWSRKAYAVFQSLGKVVHIGVILMSYNLVTKPVIAQENQDLTDHSEADTLPEVEIATSEPSVVMGLSGVPQQSIRFAESAIQDASELAQDFAGTDIRQRGIHGVQGDVSIRGGSPEQAGILLNGIPLNDVQTGHHNLDLPIPAISLTQVQRYTPGTSQQPGSGIYSGALNYQNLPDGNKRLRIWLAGGQYNYLDASAAADISTGKARHHLSASWKSSDGYSDNTDFKSGKAYLNSLIPLGEKVHASIQAGYLNKAFGAEAFYSTRYPKQFEAVTTLFGSARLQSEGKIKFSPAIYYRRHTDRFELFREDLYRFNNGYYINGNDTARYTPGIYEAWNYYGGHNYHMSEIYGYQADARTNNSAGEFHIGIHHKHESILSNVLGKTLSSTIDVPGQENGMYSKKAVRDQVNLLASWQSPLIYKLHLGLSGMLHYTENYGFYKYGSARIHYKANNHFNLWIAFNQSMRLPTFTDLYYSGPSNYGNPDLKPEEADNAEFGIHLHRGMLSARSQIFYQHGKNIIDWVKAEGDPKYSSMNHTSLDTYGVEFSVSLNTENISGIGSWLDQLEFNYSFMEKSKDSDELISAYALDYLKHQAFLRTSHSFGKTGLRGNITLRYQDRNGSFTSDEGEKEYPDFVLMDLTLSYTRKSQMIFIECANIFDVKVEDFGNIKLPGRWVKLGFKLDFQMDRHK